MLPPKQSETSNSLGHDWTRDRMPEWQKSWVAKEGSIFTIFSVSIDSRAHPSPDAYILIASLIVSLQPGAALWTLRSVGWGSSSACRKIE